MRLSTMITALAAIIVLTAAAILPAQMMNMMGQGTEKKNEAITEDQNVTGMMNNMSSHWKMMSDDFGKLEDHLNSMMTMNDMGQLRKEMQKHHDMMASMQQQMMESRQACSEMMSMMGSEGMHGGMMNSGNVHGGMMGGSGRMHDHMTGDTSAEPASDDQSHK